MRLIEEDALLQVPNVRKVTEYDESGEFITYLAVPVEAIEKAPTIEAEPVRHGKWERWLDKEPDIYGWVPLDTIVCSVCNQPHRTKTNYCPNCGAKMDLEGLQ